MLEGSLVSGRARALLAVLALSAPGGPRAAEEPPSPESEPVELPEIEVRIPRAEVERDPTASATVISAERFQGEVKDVGDLLATAPGVSVTRYGTVGQLATVSVRGVAADGVKVLVDGLPLGTAGGGVDLSTIPRHWISRLEVVRGVVGAQFGAGALGGAVNVVTRRAEAGHYSAEVSAGGLETRAASADAALAAGPFTIFAAAAGEYTDGAFTYLFDDRENLPGTPLQELRRENNAARRGGVVAKIGGSASGLRLDGLAQLSGGRRELPGPPGPVPAPGDWHEDARALAMVRLTRALGGDLTGSLRLHGRADRLDTRLASLGGVPTRQRGGAGGVEVELGLAHGRGLLTGFLSAEAEGYTSERLGGARLRPSFAVALAEDVVTGSGRLRLGPAVRVERTGRYSGLSAKLGAALRLRGDVGLRASVGRTYRVPSFAELFLEQGLLAPNPDLGPETGAGGDAALVYDGRLGLLSAGGHATVYEDMITYEPVGARGFRPFNLARALVTGLEVEVATAPVRRLLGLAISGAYTYQPTEVLRGRVDELGNDLPRRPRQRLFARAAIAPGPFEAHVDVRRVGRQYLGSRNLDPVPAAASLDCGAAFRFSRRPRASLHVELENATNRRTLRDGYGNPLPGRTLMVTVRVAG